MESRHRSTVGNLYSDGHKRRLSNSSSFKETVKLLYPIQQRGSCCKFQWLRYFVVFFVFGSLLTVLHSPVSSHYANSSRYNFRSSFSSVGWMWRDPIPETIYASNSDIDWVHILKSLSKLQIQRRESNIKLGLLNFNSSEISHWKKMLPSAEISMIRLENAAENLAWEKLYPEWIDEGEEEEEEEEVPSCPPLPGPKVPKGSNFGLIAVKLPCNKTGNWTRDVPRLHLQLSAAKLAADSEEEGEAVHVLLVTDCLPVPNLFSCKNLVVKEGSAWLYKPDLQVLKQKLKLPVGSCELSLPLKQTVRPPSNNPKREAYATILHSEDEYVCGAIAAARSIRLTNSSRDLVVLVDEAISPHHKFGLRSAGWKIITIRRIRNPRAQKDAYNEWNYSKFRLWQLTDYDKLIFIDADLLILRNIDFLFAVPEISATGNNGSLFNSGVMVIEPSNCTFELLMDHINDTHSYNGGDQGYLNEIFTWWHRIPRRMNFLKHFWVGDGEGEKEKKTHLFAANPPELYVLHYLGFKPWLCFRDYDCNWNVDFMQEFASDVAHEKWWRVHDSMPEKLQEFCLLSTQRKAGLEWERRKAEDEKYGDGHWRRKVRDPRMEICRDDYCDWRSMLLHWGDPLYNDGGPGFGEVVKKVHLF
ncbi:UDP-glucuronate:xylan alpha-glucuronosyltransferase 1 [Apostasia shenzhenica]|uniref:Hexosyltransferase n=1 Tax=Apostasia shenzhenica TaxID=1088818 RepID=A0A2I0ANK6_9ASPA|nr:UDP-glucuronate:xylan alpha-glucuronosyltransferase 1 [Apostasia shenzhenica]